MNRTILALSLAALAAPAAPLMAQGPAPGSPRLTTYLPSESSPLVALRVIVRAGSQNDPKGKEGLAALTASLVAQGGTKDLTYEQILQKFYPMAAELGSNCLKEVTVVSGTIQRDNLAEYEKSMTQMLAAPRFAPEDFERLRNEQLDYLTKVLRGGNDEELGKQALQLMIYPPGHPYGHVDEGTVAGLKAITLDDVKAFHKQHYDQATVRLGVAGGADRAFVETFRRDLDALPGGAGDVPDLPDVAPPSGLDVTIVEKPADATAISIGFPVDVTRRDDDFYALALANSYLGEHRTFNGRLQVRLRSARGLNYGNYSYIEDFLQEGGSNLPVPNNPRRQQYFSIWIRPVAPDRAPFALRAALFELDQLVDKGMSAEDFEATRTFLLNYSNLWVQTLSRRLGYAMEGQTYGRDDLVAEMQRRLPTLTVEQVNAALRTHLKPKGMYVAMVAQDAEALGKRLTSGDPTPMTYDTAGTPKDILNEDKTIERFPLGNVKVKVVPAAEMFEK
jgi:zinc protease